MLSRTLSLNILVVLLISTGLLVAQPDSWQAHTAPVHHLSFSPDGKTLLSAGFDNTAKLWSWPDGKEKKVLSGHTGPV